MAHIRRNSRIIEPTTIPPRTASPGFIGQEFHPIVDRRAAIGIIHPAAVSGFALVKIATNNRRTRTVTIYPATSVMGKFEDTCSLQLPFCFSAPHTLQGAQVDQDIDQGVEVSDGGPVTELWAFDAERNP